MDTNGVCMDGWYVMIIFSRLALFRLGFFGVPGPGGGNVMKQ